MDSHPAYRQEASGDGMHITVDNNPAYGYGEEQGNEYELCDLPSPHSYEPIYNN